MRRALIGTASGMLCLLFAGAPAIVTIAEEKESAEAAALIERDRKQIEGRWVVVELVASGNRAQVQDASKITVVNGSDGTWSLLSEGQLITKGTSTFDPTQTPKTLDFTPTMGDQAGQKFWGIYELGKDTRKMCFAPVSKPRPTEFGSPAGSGIICLKFEREKSE